MSRMGRWLTVQIVAWAMRRGLDTATIDEAMRKSHPHRDWAWRAQVYDDARARTGRQAARL